MRPQFGNAPTCGCSSASRRSTSARASELKAPALARSAKRGVLGVRRPANPMKSRSTKPAFPLPPVTSTSCGVTCARVCRAELDAWRNGTLTPECDARRMTPIVMRRASVKQDNERLGPKCRAHVGGRGHLALPGDRAVVSRKLPSPASSLWPAGKSR